MLPFRSAATRLPSTFGRCLPLGRRAQSTLKDNYEFVKAHKEGGVGIIQLFRPKALNALCDSLFEDLIHAGRAFDQDEEIGCMVLTGSPKAFAAGADISEMSTKTFDHVYSKVQQRETHCFVVVWYIIV